MSPITRGCFCLDCGYDLQGLTKGDCPECGRPFDLANTKTYRSRKLQIVDRLFDSRDVATRLLGHLPYGRRQEIAKALNATWRIRRHNLYVLGYMLCLGFLSAADDYLFKPTDNQTLTFAGYIVFILLAIGGFLFLGKRLNRVYGEELRRMNIRPSTCPMCGYNLAGIDAPQCPKCQTPLAPDTSS